ncbi:hypothetical protein DSCA_53450 [Desulfosarcina alkanivorans]|jgi:hypothetical protein|uniref:Uncharacterized protein n=1 Tax=Desulfosarcina alkanivorans TaxID=571177 RepID=A0A5K7YSP4_9BACT|nr:hypothetical protein DSCA_53450 [Desulfosarcina alkanivorans]
MLEQLAGIILLGIVVFYFYWIVSAARKSIKEWAPINELTIISKQFRMFRTGPFILTCNRPVYRIITQDTKNTKKIYWIRCNSFFCFNPSNLEVRTGK